MNFVVEWTTISAPSSNGRCRIGVAKVESTARSAFDAWASRAVSAMSMMSSPGLLGVSTQMIAVFSLMAAASASVSVRSTVRMATPQRTYSFCRSRKVPP